MMERLFVEYLLCASHTQTLCCFFMTIVCAVRKLKFREVTGTRCRRESEPKSRPVPFTAFHPKRGPDSEQILLRLVHVPVMCQGLAGVLKGQHCS